MFCMIFFDFCFIYGDCFLFLVLIMYIFEVFDDQEIFFVYLGKNVLQNLLFLMFFWNFVVESSGVYKDEFDIKVWAMMFLVDVVCLLVLYVWVGMINNIFCWFECFVELEF